MACNAMRILASILASILSSILMVLQCQLVAMCPKCRVRAPELSQFLMQATFVPLNMHECAYVCSCHLMSLYKSLCAIPNETTITNVAQYNAARECHLCMV